MNALQNRLLQFAASPELGLVSTLVFAGLYTWPLLTSERASSTFTFYFVVWSLHVVVIGLTSFASRRVEALAPAVNDCPPASS